MSATETGPAYHELEALVNRYRTALQTILTLKPVYGLNPNARVAVFMEGEDHTQAHKDQASQFGWNVHDVVREALEEK